MPFRSMCLPITLIDSFCVWGDKCVADHITGASKCWRNTSLCCAKSLNKASKFPEFPTDFPSSASPLSAMHSLPQYKTALAIDISTARFFLIFAALRESTCAEMVDSGFSKECLNE